MKVMLATVVALLAVLTVAPLASAGSNNTDMKCYQCYGVMGERTNCGATLSPDDVINTTRCAHSCAKVVIYMVEQKIAISRDCVERCEDGCVKNLASHCYYCCHSTLCNSSPSFLQNPTHYIHRYATLVILPVMFAIWD